MNPFSLIIHIWQTNCQTGVQPWDYSLLLLISIDSNPSVPSSSDVAHTCSCTLVHGSLWLVSTNHSNALRLQKCVYGEHISFELISESLKYFRLQECQWFPGLSITNRTLLWGGPGRCFSGRWETKPLKSKVCMHACLLSSKGNYCKSRKWFWKCSKRAGESCSTTTWPKDIAMKMIRKISRKSLQNLQRDSCKRRRKWSHVSVLRDGVKEHSTY